VYACVCVYVCVCVCVCVLSGHLKIIGLFCKIALYKRRYSANETYHFKEPSNRSQPIVCSSFRVLERVLHGKKAHALHT